MKRYLMIFLLLSGSLTIAAAHEQQYQSVIWNDLKVDNPNIRDVFVNVQHELNEQHIVIPAFVVKSWMKTDAGEPVYFLSAQPYVCEHAKPPYANQMIKIDNPKNIVLAADNAIPIYAFGKITIEKNKAGLFSSAYSLDLQEIQDYTPKTI